MKVYFGNLSWTVQDSDLHEFASKIGKVKTCQVAFSQGKSRGYGLVEYESDRDAEDAIHDLNDTDLMGRRVFVREDRQKDKPEFQVKHSTTSSPQLFVGNLPYRTSWQDLKDLFRPIPGLIRADVMQDRDGRSRGCGILVFETVEDAQEAIDKMNGYDFDGRVIQVREDLKGSVDRGSRYDDRDRGYGRRDYRDYDRDDRGRGRYDRYDRAPRYDRDRSRSRDRYRARSPRRRSLSRSPSPRRDASPRKDPRDRSYSRSPVRRSESPRRDSPVRKSVPDRDIEMKRADKVEDEDINLYD